jgi:hypothetical protein
MPRPPSGPIGNSPRDLRDDFVGEAAEPAKGGKVPRWPPNPKRVVRPKNDFHSKVSGGSASRRADRSPSFRRGHFMKRGGK